MFKYVSMESGIGAISAIGFWIVVIILFCIFPRRRNNVEEAILDIMKSAVKEVRVEEKLAKEYSSRGKSELHNVIIANNADFVTRRGSKMMGRWEVELEESWNQRDIKRWYEKSDTLKPSSETLKPSSDSGEMNSDLDFDVYDSGLLRMHHKTIRVTVRGTAV